MSIDKLPNIIVTPPDSLVQDYCWARQRVEELSKENATLREMLDLAFRIPNMTDAELAELIRNCRAALGTAAKEAQP